jgi:hypothetical protein
MAAWVFPSSGVKMPPEKAGYIRLYVTRAGVFTFVLPAREMCGYIDVKKPASNYFVSIPSLLK